MASSNHDDTCIGINNHHHQQQQLHPLAFSILWSPLPPITWFLPFIGHMGITTSHGTACDFQGPYSVGDRGKMAFGTATRALQIDITSLPAGGAEQWDKAIAEANAEYRTRMHNICCDNCHSHVAWALNDMEITAFGIRQWDMVKLCFLVFFKGRFLSLGGFVTQFLPFGPFLLIVILVRLL
ncbi:TMEM222 family protein [Skeletonema marinoi]|uniref:TMEM222 family protein n=1 Tax=Skeletonema marinoi TaxID=267567 RepID=A0AAD8XWE8_9STRA|nr:TMEM222 family protein [Skeletonema marinoi]